MATCLRVGVTGGFQFQFPVLACSETLPFVLEDVCAGPAFLEINELASARRAGQCAFHTEIFRHFDDFLPALVIEIHRPVIHPVRPLLRQHVAGDDAFVSVLQCL